MSKKCARRMFLKKLPKDEKGKVLPIKSHEIFTFYTPEKFFEALAFARELMKEDMERQAEERKAKGQSDDPEKNK